MHTLVLGDCVYMCERGREGVSKQLMDWCALFFFPPLLFLALGQGHICMYITRKRASSYATYFYCYVGNMDKKNPVFTLLPANK